MCPTIPGCLWRCAEQTDLNQPEPHLKTVDKNDFDGPDPSKVPAPSEIFERRLQLRGFLVPLLSLLSCVLLTVSFLGWWVHLPYMAFFALVPWGLALGGSTSRRWAILWAWFAGLAFFSINHYWLLFFELTTYLGVLYLSVYWLIAAIILRAASRRCWPMWICLPLVWVALEFVRARVSVLGFPWMSLAHSQYCRSWLIQISDITGIYGVSLIVAMANGVIIDLLALPLFGRQGERKARILRRGPFGVVAFAIILGGMLTYGWYRTEIQSGHLSPGPSIAVVQTAFPQSLYEPPVPHKKVFAEHRLASEAFANSECDLLVWSESMAPPGLNPGYMKLLRDGETRQENLQYLAAIKTLLGDLDCPLLTGGSTAHDETPAGASQRVMVRRNSALWFNKDGKITDQYAKRHLVPFSEYVPFKQSWPWLHELLRGPVPKGMHQLQPGKKWTRFKLEGKSRSWTIASPICFEGTFPEVCRQMVTSNGRKRVDILINLSNDGWFVWKYGDRPYRDSVEHSQHLVQYYFRAVENRVPVVRCVNTGISASIDSNGREVARISRHGATMVPGSMLLGAKEDDTENPPPTVKRGYQAEPGVLVDSRQSLYSICGDLFAWIIVAAAGAMICVMLLRRSVDKKG